VARKKPRREIRSDAGAPAQLYHFVDVASFTEDWADLRLGDDDLRALEDEIARNPTRAPVVAGGGGARKIRRPDPVSGKGKSGGYRVLYAVLPDYGRYSSSRRGPSRSARISNPTTTRPSGMSSPVSEGFWRRGRFDEQ
jgi:mRNA-degrading endonuclease RelE of RelBE toxin-antitoxin system